MADVRHLPADGTDSLRRKRLVLSVACLRVVFHLTTSSSMNWPFLPSVPCRRSPTYSSISSGVSISRMYLDSRTTQLLFHFITIIIIIIAALRCCVLLLCVAAQLYLCVWFAPAVLLYWCFLVSCSSVRLVFSLVEFCCCVCGVLLSVLSKCIGWISLWKPAVIEIMSIMSA